jgi:hypothetical protein
VTGAVEQDGETTAVRVRRSYQYVDAWISDVCQPICVSSPYLAYSSVLSLMGGSPGGPFSSSVIALDRRFLAPSQSDIV